MGENTRNSKVDNIQAIPDNKNSFYCIIKKRSKAFKTKLYPAYRLLIAFSLAFIALGFILDTPANIFSGLQAIIISPSILVSDYIAIGGIGAAFVNAGLCGLICIGITFASGIKPTGATIASISLILGFALFGKNIVNIWPIMCGVWFFSKYRKEPFRNYILPAMFGTTLAPAVTMFTNADVFPNTGIAILVGAIIGVVLGFIIPPVASHTVRVHQGYNLYNIGFAAGMLGLLTMSVIRLFGIEIPSELHWATGYNTQLFIFLMLIFISLIIIGIKLEPNWKTEYKLILAQPGKLISDFLVINGFGATIVNMGILGILSTLLVLVLGADFNGPTVGGIFTVVGFGAFGKHILNVVPVILGAIIAAAISSNPFTAPAIILAILFVTGIAPISGHFGWPYGIIAGFVHMAIVLNVTYLHGGINLYNNGFAAGLVSIILVPLFTAFKTNFNEHLGKNKSIK